MCLQVTWGWGSPGGQVRRMPLLGGREGRARGRVWMERSICAVLRLQPQARPITCPTSDSPPCPRVGPSLPWGGHGALRLLRVLAG